jgi:positive regulator of sigma E activity
MWQHWVNGILGLWIILMAFSGLSGNKILLIITGLIIAILSFWIAFSPSPKGGKKEMMSGGSMGSETNNEPGGQNM